MKKIKKIKKEIKQKRKALFSSLAKKEWMVLMGDGVEEARADRRSVQRRPFILLSTNCSWESSCVRTRNPDELNETMNR